MARCESIQEIITFRKEQELDNIINSCHRSVDWFVSMYFKQLKKSAGFFAERAICSETVSFNDICAGYIMNHSDINQLVDDIQTHINSEIIPNCHDNNLPQAILKTPDLKMNTDFIALLLDEQKATIRISRQTQKWLEHLTAKTVVNITPWWVSKKIVNKAGIILAKKIARNAGADEGQRRQEAADLLEKQIKGVLNCLEKKLKDQLKYQLSDQLYSWFDQKENKDVVLSGLGKVI